ncbi:MAG: hemolysin XhlA family protein [Xenococcaceae cyanobacterium MO_167.B52]|nr:hemolysin XhlA family protein [Xenococcaceae cyanobacterium MO_167.B52]
MSNISIETDLKEILQELKEGQNKIIDKVEAIDKRLTKVETKLDSELPAMQKSIDEIKGSQQAQIWTLIGILITAVGGFLVAVGRFVFTTNP